MKTDITNELKRIASENGGILMPEAVVEEARPKASLLHSRFEWDDSVAGHQYRVWQARQLISVTVQSVGGSEEKSNVFVSLTTDRREGGYRIMTDVLSDADMRKQMFSDALAELSVFQDKYKRLKQLSIVFRAIRKVRSR